jgi:hypothetical protein
MTLRQAIPSVSVGDSGSLGRRPSRGAYNDASSVLIAA